MARPPLDCGKARSLSVRHATVRGQTAKGGEHATLFFRCPVTGREVSTGLEIDRASYARIDDDYVEISCPYCKEPHPLASVKSWLEDAAAFETRVN